MKRLFIVIGLIILLLIPVACAKSENAGESHGILPVPAPEAPREDGKAWLDEGDYTSDTVNGERMIVRTGDMSLIVVDVAETRDEIASLAVRLGGYVVSSYISGTDENIRGSIAIRVPDEEFDTALAELRALAVRVTSEQTNSRDVTEEYIDLQARLGNAEATEKQYLALLEKADDVEDILKIYDKLSQVRSEIEQLKGQIQYLERTAAMSYIEIDLRPEASTKPLVRAGWSALETLKAAVRGLVTAGQIIASIAIWLLIFIPIWGTALGIVIWRIRRKRQKKLAPPA